MTLYLVASPEPAFDLRIRVARLFVEEQQYLSHHGSDGDHVVFVFDESYLHDSIPLHRQYLDVPPTLLISLKLVEIPERFLQLHDQCLLVLVKLDGPGAVTQHLHI